MLAVIIMVLFILLLAPYSAPKAAITNLKENEKMQVYSRTHKYLQELKWKGNMQLDSGFRGW